MGDRKVIQITTESVPAGTLGLALAVHGGVAIYEPSETPARSAALQAATEAGWLRLEDDPVEAVVAAVLMLELNPLFNAGKGARLNAEGRVELDAGVMSGTTRQAGAVGAVANVASPVQLARLVMEHSPHVLLVADGAARFATRMGMKRVRNRAFVTASRKSEWRSSGVDTVGAVARDRHGRLAVATSTGGPAGKWLGRVGDTPIPGAGFYAEDGRGAACATGQGDKIIVVGVSRDAVDGLDREGPGAAAHRAIRHLDATGGIGGVLVVSTDGRIGLAHNAIDMPWHCRIA
jgi:beta-aspartyl-peptidase (threonine type)